MSATRFISLWYDMHSNSERGSKQSVNEHTPEQPNGV